MRLSRLLLVLALLLPTLLLWQDVVYKPISKASPLLAYRHPKIPQVSSNAVPKLQAESYILIDDTTNTVLLAKDINTQIYPASITKLATALTALNIYPLDEQITVAQEYKEGKIMELRIGEKITVRSLVSALLVYSANDAAFNLASHHSAGTIGFVKEMNLIAQKYNLKNTHFTNYDGIHNPDHYSTVYDLAQLGRLAIKNPIIREMVKTQKITVSDIDNKVNHSLVTTNELLGNVPEIEGLKTGWTPEAGGCFVSLINLNGHNLIGVVAQSPDRFDDTKKLISWSRDNITWSDYQP